MKQWAKSRPSAAPEQQIAPSKVAEKLKEGAALLDELIRSNGFTFAVTSSGAGSGGHFASGEFRRDNRRLELHVRGSLGLVTYHVGIFELTHEDYMWSVLGRRWASQYPGFSNETLDAFRHLLADLQQYGTDFLAGTEEDFVKHVRRARELKGSVPRLP